MITNPEEDYARGYVPFLDCTIYLDSRPLIPRTETEFWTEKAIATFSPTVLAFEDVGGDSVFHCLDLFAGSGAIGIAILKHVPHAEVDFGEINDAHFPTIRKSLKKNGIAEKRAGFVKTDVWSAVSGTYDHIFANPPYLSKTHSPLQESVVRLEPHEALYAEEDGFALIRKTLEGARGHLTRRGELYIEHEPGQVPLIERTARTLHLSVRTKNDQYGVPRYSIFSAP